MSAFASGRFGRSVLIAVATMLLVGTLSWAETAASAPSSSDDTSTGEPPTGESPTAIDAAVDEYLQSEMDQQGLPGASIAIIRDGSIEHLAAFGEADDSGRPMTPQTPVLLASLSKQFTATAIMQLVDAGKIELDAPVQRYLPWFQVADPAMSPQITVEQLLHHTSGLPHASDNVILDDVGDDQDAASLEAGVRALSAVHLRDVPGGSFEYTNLGYNTLGMVVEAVSGQRFSDYLDANVFGPLQMQCTHGTAQAAQEDGGAQGYYRWFGTIYEPESAATPVALQPSATLFSCAEDLAHVLLMNLQRGTYGGAEVLSADSVEALQSSGPVVGDDDVSYGMGWWNRPQWELSADPGDPVSDAATDRVLEHNGSWPNTHTYLGYVPATGMGFVLLVNGNDLAAESRLLTVDRNVWNILLGKPTEPAEVTEEFLLRYGSWVAVAIVALQLSLMWWSIWLLNRRSRTGELVPAGRRSAAVLIPLAVDLGVVILAVWYLPTHFETPLRQIVRSAPDSGLLIVIALTLAVGWGTTQTILLLRRPCVPAIAQPSVPEHSKSVAAG